MLKSNLVKNQSNHTALRALAQRVGDLDVEHCEPYRAELLDAVNAAAAALPDGYALAGEHFDDRTPTIVLLRALGTLASMVVPQPLGSPPTGFAMA